MDNRNRRRRNRRRRDKVQSRRFVLVTIIALVLTGGGVLTAAAFTGAQAFLNSCSLASLKPVSIGENSFVYAADGSVLGSIPAEQNRQPVALDQMSPLLAQATVAIEDRRFYSHSGVDFEGIPAPPSRTSRRARSSRAARRSRSSSSATSTSAATSPGSGRRRRPASR